MKSKLILVEAPAAAPAPHQFQNAEAEEDLFQSILTH